jgi:hypothetical protein
MKSWSVRVLTRVILLTKFPAHAAQNSSSSLSSSSLLPSSSNECRSLRATSRALPSDWELSRVSTGSIQDGLTTGSALQQMAARIDELEQNKPDGSPTAHPNITTLKAKSVALQTRGHQMLQSSLRYFAKAFSWPMANSSDKSPFPAAQKVRLAEDSGNREASKGYRARTPSTVTPTLSVYCRFMVGLLSCSHSAKPSFNYSRFGIHGLFFVARCLKYSFGY